MVIIDDFRARPDWLIQAAGVANLDQPPDPVRDAGWRPAAIALSASLQPIHGKHVLSAGPDFAPVWSEELTALPWRMFEPGGLDRLMTRFGLTHLVVHRRLSPPSPEPADIAALRGAGRLQPLKEFPDGIVYEVRGTPTGAARQSGQLFPALLSRLGSRLTVIPEPDKGRTRILPLGPHLPELSGLNVTIGAAGGPVSFPGRGGEPPAGLQQTVTPTGIAYRLPLPDGQGHLCYELLAPLWPGDRHWSTAPFMLLRLELTNTSGAELALPVAVELARGINAASGMTIIRTPERTINAVTLAHAWKFELDQQRQGSGVDRGAIAPHLRQMSLDDGGDWHWRVSGCGDLCLAGDAAEGWSISSGQLVANVTLAPGESQQLHLVLAFYTDTPLLLVDQNPRPLAYSQQFTSADQIVAMALVQRRAFMDVDRQFHRLLVTEDMPPNLYRLTCLGLQSLLANSWLISDGADGWLYSEWEGFPRFHCTLDVVFNTSPFYILFAPDLLADMLRMWPRYGWRGHVPHDAGKGLIIGRNAYPIPMTVEEDTNFILLHALYANFTGDADVAASQAAFITGIVRGLIDADKDGNGLPDRGTVNTFDDAPPSVNAAANQLYLGVKILAALKALPLLTGIQGHVPPELQDQIDRRIATLEQTLSGSWTGTHYPLISGPASAGPARHRAGVLRPAGAQRTAGLDQPELDSPTGYGNYLAHGWVPLLWMGEPEPLNALPHLAAHLAAAERITATPYGSAHRDGHANVWVSQNLWRDAAALYLGATLPYAQLLDNYWAVQTKAYVQGLTDPAWLPYCDSPINSYLTYYGRGAAALLYPWAGRGISFSRARRELRVPAASRTAPLPLPFLADWQTGTVPVLHWTSTGEPDPSSPGFALVEHLTIRQ